MDAYHYRIDDHWEVLAGRTDADNDRLSLKVARANDWWFHVSGQPGSHVTVSLVSQTKKVGMGSTPGVMA